jgi:hypothetical protein
MGQVAEWSQRERPPGRPLPEAHRRVKEELTHIPRGERGSPQHLFRDAYTIVRLHGMAKGHSAWQALEESLQLVRKDHPDDSLECDETWFRARNEEPSQANQRRGGGVRHGREVRGPASKDVR